MIRTTSRQQSGGAGGEVVGERIERAVENGCETDAAGEEPWVGDEQIFQLGEHSHGSVHEDLAQRRTGAGRGCRGRPKGQTVAAESSCTYSRPQSAPCFL